MKQTHNGPDGHLKAGPKNARPEVWGGVEATVNRVGDRYFDQMQRSGHADRIEDLDLFASLGIKAIRYPVLWERISPNGIEQADWSWPEARLTRLRELNIRPIVGLLHHGSGPKDTSLVDPAFPERLAAYAKAVASRFPWIEDYTPVNEPLTTARFSALYGHWYPHGRDNTSFAKAIVNECKATVLAMQAIRSVQPRARLIQTEDLGHTHSTPHMNYQAAFENERRWLSFDLLTGQLDEGHRMWGWLVDAGISPDELQWFRENPCPPNVMAINYYLTSERFLDERLDLYPEETAGSNGTDTYVDLSALHVLPKEIGGFRFVMTQAWERYHRPMCIGEAHLGGTVEEQMRWLNDAWADVQHLRQKGVDVRAVTIWALLGSFDWPSLVTREDGHYEPGPFDVRAPQPRPTALARMVEGLANTGVYHHPVLSIPGWWRRPERFQFRHIRPSRVDLPGVTDGITTGASAPRLAIVGSDTPLRRALVDACRMRCIPVEPFEAKRAGSLIQNSETAAVWATLLTDTISDNEDTSLEEASSWRELTAALAGYCAGKNLPFAMLSGPSVFDGRSTQPYTESCNISPTSHAGEVLVNTEQQVLRLHPAALVMRTGHIFGPGMEALQDGGLSDGDVFTPTYSADLAKAVIDLLLDGETGIWHLANTGVISGGQFRNAIREAFGEQIEDPAPFPQEPRMRALVSERAWVMPDWESALAHYIELEQETFVSSTSAPAGDD